MTSHPIQQLVDHYLVLKEDEEVRAYESYVKTAKEILTLTGGVKKGKELIDKTKEWAESKGLEWGMETSVKRYLEL